MSRTVKLIIQDEINARFVGLDIVTRDKMIDQLTYFVPGFMHMPNYRLGRWDGKIRLMTNTGKTYINLLPDIIDVLDECGYELEIEDQRPEHDLDFPQVDANIFADATSHLEKPIILRDYQVAAVNIALTEKVGVLELATGAGKTFTTAAISKVLSEKGNVVMVVPTIDLAVQSQASFKKVGIQTGLWFGEVKDRQRVTISTWQSLDNYHELFEGVIGFIIDECQNAKAKTLVEMLSGPGANVPVRLGCTGTIPKEPLYRQQIKAVIGPTIFTIRAHELQKRGVLAQSPIKRVIFKDTKNPSYHVNSEHFEEWKDELDWMFGNEDRIEYMSSMISTIAEEYGNTLVLVRYRDHGKALHNLIPGSISLDGKDKSKKRMAQYSEFNEKDNGVMIVTSGIASTGIDIPRIFNLVIIELGKKFEGIVQSIGRGLRKADDKDTVLMWDMRGDSGYSKAHGRERDKMYAEERHTDIETLEVNYYADLN